MDRIVAVNSNCYHGYSIEEAIEGIKNAGFHYIELTATKGWTEHVFPTMSFNRLWEIREMLKKADLKPFSMSGHTNLMDTQRIPDFISNMRLASFFDCEFIVSSIGEAHIEDKALASNEQVAEHIKNLVPYLEELDLKLVLEVHGDHGTGKILKEIVKLVGSPLVRINYDTANAIYFGDVDLKEDFESCIDEVSYLHIKDKAGGRQEWNFPAIGSGYVDFPMVFAMLDEDNNNSPLSIEIEFTQSGAKDLHEINTAVKDSADYLKKLGFEL